MKRFKIQAEFLQRARAEIFHQHIALHGEITQNLAPLICFQIYYHATFVAVDAQIIRALPTCKRRTPTACLVAFGRLHFDDFRSQVTENHRTIRASQHTAEVEHTDIL